MIGAPLEMRWVFAVVRMVNTHHGAGNRRRWKFAGQQQYGDDYSRRARQLARDGGGPISSAGLCR